MEELNVAFVETHLGNNKFKDFKKEKSRTFLFVIKK